jgi:hypothetical protein
VEGQGNSLELEEYNFTDTRPHQGLNYYRLRQIDFDDATEYSPIEVVIWQNKVASDISIYPNPTSDLLYLQTHTAIQEAQVVIYDEMGRLVKRTTVNSATVSVQDLPIGSYLLVLKVGEYLYTEQFVKNQ